MKKLILFLGLISSLCIILYIGINVFINYIEQPKYDILSSYQNIEIRKYQPMVIATVQISGTRNEALTTGFKKLSDYLFGNNTDNKRLSMTAPVRQQKNNQSWIISFIMPSQYTINTLPKPKNNDVQLKALSAKKYVVIRFSGKYSNANFLKYKEKIMDYMKKNHLQAISSIQYAFYNPPHITLPFLRRNEIMFEIR